MKKKKEGEAPFCLSKLKRALLQKKSGAISGGKKKGTSKPTIALTTQPKGMAKRICALRHGGEGESLWEGKSSIGRGGGGHLAFHGVMIKKGVADHFLQCWRVANGALGEKREKGSFGRKRVCFNSFRTRKGRLR